MGDYVTFQHPGVNLIITKHPYFYCEMAYMYTPKLSISGHKSVPDWTSGANEQHYIPVNAFMRVPTDSNYCYNIHQLTH